jgi:hypothetical protein
MVNRNSFNVLSKGKEEADNNDNTLDVLGCICYTHTKYLQFCFRLAADCHNISMNDIHAYMLWGSDQLPDIPSESRYAKMYIPNPRWKKEDEVVTKWIPRGEGNVGICKFCRVEYIFVHYSTSGKYVCDDCDLKVYSLGCYVCKSRLNSENVHLHFPIDKEERYICKTCYTCLECGKALKDYAEEIHKKKDYNEFRYDIRSGRVDDLRICGACNKLKDDNNGYGKVNRHPQ